MLAKRPIVRRVRYANMYISLQRCRKMSFLEGDVHVWLGCAAERGSDNKKAPVAGSFFKQNGGGGGMSKFWAELKIYPVGLRRPRCAKNAPRARFLYAPRPGGFESLLRRICL